ncbi:HAMP domain-containing protein [Alkalithermobacter thermoalcaliphilus JW-YL-7 = DSM 7308]|uniref:histidine kinase n=1 Tax=Alkalithermobacter thermoalcaliphilus JW-YL-7 = DSM 7308 TaxID=1121328 RepID=A0A150FR71_CLOPD|nr:histidine kinase [[Clostridium] paradoxum JW-YL-7 = DSM 7308]SHL02135.1 HAMP domain-containing protein [[Clostridium] paradoxum JW-YL-7 = DSM 7308]
MLVTVIFIFSAYMLFEIIEKRYKDEAIESIDFQFELIQRDITDFKSIKDKDLIDTVQYYNTISKRTDIKLVDTFRFVISDDANKVRIEEKIFEYTKKDGYFLDRYLNKIIKVYPIYLNKSLQGYIYAEYKAYELNNIKLIFAFFVVMNIFILILTVAYTYNSVVDPIKKVNTAFENIYRGNLYESVDVEGGGELSRLCSNFNTMSKILSKIEQQRREFIHNVSHELKTPLSSIKLLIESLKYGTYEDLNIYKEFFKDIYGEVERMKQIIDDLMIIVDIDEKKSKLNLELAHINYLIDKVINRMHLKAKSKNINIIYKEIDNIQIKLDIIKIDRVITNILDNAIKYSNENGNIYIYLYNEENYAVIKVKDEGVGIPEEDLSRIFERFYRVDKARSRETGGSGLGLFIAKQLVDLHEGEILVESKLKQGSIFYVKIPVDLI